MYVIPNSKRPNPSVFRQKPSDQSAPTISYSIQLAQLKDQSGHEESYLREAEDSDSLTSRIALHCLFIFHTTLNYNCQRRQQIPK